MAFKDKYRATKAMIESQRENRVPFAWEQWVKKLGLLLVWPLATFMGGMICLIEWAKKKLTK